MTLKFFDPHKGEHYEMDHKMMGYWMVEIFSLAVAYVVETRMPGGNIERAKEVNKILDETWKNQEWLNHFASYQYKWMREYGPKGPFTENQPPKEEKQP